MEGQTRSGVFWKRPVASAWPGSSGSSGSSGGGWGKTGLLRFLLRLRKGPAGPQIFRLGEQGSERQRLSGYVWTNPLTQMKQATHRAPHPGLTEGTQWGAPRSQLEDPGGGSALGLEGGWGLTGPGHCPFLAF